MIRVKSNQPIINLFLKIRKILGGSTKLSFIKSLCVVFAKLRELSLHSGNKGLVLYLKACAVCLQQAASGHKLNDLTDLKVRISRTKGLRFPRIIPSSHRKIIANRLVGWNILMKFYLTIFYIYRVIHFSPLEKLSTITDLGTVFSWRLFDRYIAGFFELFVFRNKPALRYPLETFKKNSKFFSITRSSPTSGESTWSTHPVSLIRSAWALKASPVWESFKYLSSYINIHLSEGIVMKIAGSIPGSIGKLGFKEEAAGKLRVFAMVDGFTQWLLYPLHKSIFSILRSIPMDGTFNQLRPIKRLIRLNCKVLYSLDLSAATDRLPVTLQSKLLSHWVKEIPLFGEKWSDLLVGRDYSYKLPISKEMGKLRYAVGQPMGALSSWAMLALTHHFILQCAAWRVGYPRWKLFDRYAILGDDIVIGDRDVANSYLFILNKIGVTVGIAKSVISPRGEGLEFAKRTIIMGTDVSPLSLKELAEALSSASTWAAFVTKFPLPFSKQAKILGYGYRTNTISFRKMNHALKVLWLAQIPRLSMTSQLLNLNNKVPRILEPLLPLFKKTVLRPALVQLILELRKLVLHLDHIGIYHHDRSLFTKGIEKDLSRLFGDKVTVSHLLSLDCSFDIKIQYRESLGSLQQQELGMTIPLADSLRLFERWSNLEGFRPWEKALGHGYDICYVNLIHDEGYAVIGALKAAVKICSKIENSYSMDEAFKVYFELLRLKAMTNSSALRLELVPRNPQTSLPLQARLFRNWSRLTHRLAKLIQ